MVLLFTDLVGSVAFKRRMGADEYARRLRRHDELFHQALATVPNGRVLNDTGDGFLAAFDAAPDAVNAALAFQASLRAEDWGSKPFRARAGMHVGQVAEIEEGLSGGERSKIVGLAADLASRVMSLGDGDQVLMTRPIFDDARQYVREHPGAGDDADLELEWMAHGPYELDGIDDPVDVFEVGAKGLAKLEAPTDSPKARRVVSREEAEVLGWRPAAGLEIPRRQGWTLEMKLGEGGFGDVWLARHERSEDRRAFKFCFDVEKLRSLKREMTMFRLIRRALGDRTDIARLHEVQLDSPPYFLESEFTEQGDMKVWAEKRGGLDKVGLATRLDLLQRIADAVAAAHSIGILHKDIKPSNILIALAQDGKPRPRLADFGIAALAEGQSPQGDVTMEGFTESLDVAISGGTMMSGTRMYAPPESLAGKPFTLEGDIYALGVMLYQLIIGDLSRPLAPGWERDVDDELLVEDIAASVDGDPHRRLKSAAELSSRLSQLEVRRAERIAEQQRATRDQRRTRMLRLAALGVAGLLAITLTVVWSLMRERGLREEAERAQFAAEVAQGEAITERNRAQAAEERAASEAERARTEKAIADAVNDFLNRDLLGAVRPEDQGIDVPMRRVLEVASARIEGRFDGAPAIEASIRTTLGRTYTSLGGFSEAEPHLVRAVELTDARDEESSRLLARELLGILYTLMGRYLEADPLLVGVLDARRAGGDPRAVWAALTALGRLRVDQGRYAEAEEMLVEARKEREAALTADHPEAIASARELAFLYRKWGRYDEALPIQRKGLESCERVLDEDHPDTLSARHDMAMLRLDMGRFDLAVRRSRELLVVRQVKLGPEHPRTLDTMNLLGMALFALRRDAEVEAIWTDTLDIRRRTLGSSHPNTVSSMGNLASVLAVRAQFEEAGALYREAAKRSEEARGGEHPETLDARSNLGEFLRQRGEFAEAEALFLSILEASKRVLGTGTPLLLVPMRNLANVHANQKQHDQAAELLTEALKLSRRALGDEHPLTIQTQSDLGLRLVYLGGPDKAREHLDEALQARRRALGEDHVATATTLQNLAVLEMSERNLDEARDLQETVVDVRTRALGPRHPLTLSAKSNLADVLIAQGDGTAGGLLFKEVLDACRATLGEDHPETLDAYHAFARLLMRGRKFNDAADFASRGYELAVARFGEESAAAQRAVNLLVVIHDKAGNVAERDEWKARQSP